jgi:hypothetical protein
MSPADYVMPVLAIIFGVGWHLLAVVSIVYAHLDPYLIVVAEGTLVGTITVHYFTHKEAQDIALRTIIP